MKSFSYILGIFFLSGCVAGGKLKHKYSGPVGFRPVYEIWIFEGNQSFKMNSKSRDHVKQHDCFWGTWRIKKDTLFISYNMTQDMAIGNSSKVTYLKKDTLFVNFRKVYRQKDSYGYSLNIEHHH